MQDQGNEAGQAWDDRRMGRHQTCNGYNGLHVYNLLNVAGKKATSDSRTKNIQKMIMFLLTNTISSLKTVVYK